jgi:hypothetical protein
MAALLILSLSLTATPQSNEWIEFVGFSNDERIAAYRHDVRQPRADGTMDHYSVFHTVDVASGYDVATFKGTAIENVTTDGRPVKVAKNELLQRNPIFASAYPNKRWRQLKKRSKFSKRMVSPENETVRVTSSLELARESNDRGIYLGNPGIVVFEVFGDQVGNGSRSLGRFYHKSRKSQIVARLQVFTSKSGRASAAAVIFLVNDGDKPHGVPLIKVTNSDFQLAAATPQAKTRVAEAPRSPKDEDARQERRLNSMYSWMTGEGSVRP